MVRMVANDELPLEHVGCPICGRTDGVPTGVGEDFEYRTAPDTFLALRCRDCAVVYLDPRPAPAAMGRIYPDDYHAFDFSEADFGIVHKVRSRLEAHRLIKSIGDVAADARVLDVGCGDGFHLDLLRQHGRSSWTLEGVDLDPRAVEAARRRGLTVHEGSVETLDLPASSYDVAFMIQTVEHVGDPAAVLRTVTRLLKPGGRLIIVTDNTGSPDFRVFGRRHWGGYHFPRHFSLFNDRSMRKLAGRVGLEVVGIETIVSPVNWVYSIRNLLDDYGAPESVVSRFTLSSPVSLGVFTLFDAAFTMAGKGALIRAELRRPV
ncbi:MAG: methyltransferase [Actinomycetia bacterium]|nr:methyltransferase [Actinomycetes bacterium]